jgi:hypothetical protein
MKNKPLNLEVVLHIIHAQQENRITHLLLSCGGMNWTTFLQNELNPSTAIARQSRTPNSQEVANLQTHLTRSVRGYMIGSGHETQHALCRGHSSDMAWTKFAGRRQQRRRNLKSEPQEICNVYQTLIATDWT